MSSPRPPEPAPSLQEPSSLDNADIASRFDEIARLLEEQQANPFRVQAYRTAANTLRSLDRPVRELLEDEGLKGLRDLPGIGNALARAIEQLLRTGRLGLLDHLRGEDDPEKLLATVPGIGPVLAHRIHEHLGIATLADLEVAAHDGRLDEIPGFGPARIRAVRESLRSRLQAYRQRPEVRDTRQPAVADLLDVDAEYRSRAAEDNLPRISPRRFNPTREAWLPVLHTARSGHRYSALFSNTARAHALNKTNDWVVIYQETPDRHRPWTVVTATHGLLRGKRIVRGREADCLDHYRNAPASSESSSVAAHTAL